jgi:hypothetical protein
VLCLIFFFLRAALSLKDFFWKPVAWPELGASLDLSKAVPEALLAEVLIRAALGMRHAK